MKKRCKTKRRKTKETDVEVMISLDDPAGLQDEPSIFGLDSGIGFFDHMLDVFAYQADMGLALKVNGDLQVDDHHTIEDVGITMGQLIDELLEDRKGIYRYGSSRVPMDESLAVVDLDFSGRPFLHFDAEFTADKIGDFSTQMVEEFLRALAVNAKITLHVSVPYGKNDHHKAEAIFKALGQAMGRAVSINPRKAAQIPSTKGIL